MSVPASSYACSHARIIDLSPQPLQNLHANKSSNAETCSTPMQYPHRCQAAKMHTACTAHRGAAQAQSRMQMCSASPIIQRGLLQCSKGMEGRWACLVGVLSGSALDAQRLQAGVSPGIHTGGDQCVHRLIHATIAFSNQHLQNTCWLRQACMMQAGCRCTRPGIRLTALSS